MKKKVLTTLITLSFISLLFLFKFFLWKEKTEEIDCEKEFQYPLFRLICQAYKEKDVEKCDYFRHAYKELCAKAALAKVDVNRTFCNSLKDRAYKDVCFMKLAIETKEHVYCPNDCCKFIVGTPEACKNISNEVLKSECFAKAYKDERYCLKIPDEHIKNECICLSDSGNKKECKRFVFENINPKECESPLCVSFNIKNLDQCEEFLSGEESELCKLFYLTKIFYGSGNLCVYTEDYLLYGS